MIPYSNGFEHRLLYDLVVVLEVDAEDPAQIRVRREDLQAERLPVFHRIAAREHPTSVG